VERDKPKNSESVGQNGRHFKMAAIAMETAKMLKIEKHKNDHSRILAKQKLMKLNRNNTHI
jgi:hemerythrin